MNLLAQKIFYFTLSTVLLHTFLCGTPVKSYEYSATNKKLDSKFKSLDRVINRLDGVSTSALKTPGDGSNKSRNKLRELNSSDIPEPQDFPEIDEEGLDDDDDSSYEDENETEVLNDNTSHWHNPYRSSFYKPSKFGAQVTSTTTTTTTTTTPSPPLSYSQMKWRDLGSRQAVEQSRLRNSYSSNTGASHHQYSHSSNHRNSHHQPSSNNQNIIHHNSHGSSTNGYNNYSGSRSNTQQTQSPDTSIREAINHALKVSREGSCKIPKPRLVRVQDFYPHPGKTYVPHCTILHQCSDDTGCCRHDVLTCSPKTTQRVELYFYTILAENNRASSVERLVFYNHTECECRDKMEDLMPRDVPIPASGVSDSSSPALLSVTQQSVSSGSSIIPNPRYDPRSRNLQCKCPSVYSERVLQDGSCTCDCFDKQRECLRLKKGKDFFTMQDKWCIQSGRCEIPGCTYGSYIHLIGRCPRKQERSGHSLAWNRYLT